MRLMDNDSDPVTIWIDELRQSDENAARNIWQHFVLRLQASARKKLRLSTRQLYDEEDAAQSAFHSLCAGISNGRFPELGDRQSLWQLLLVITSRKIARRHRYDQRQRRDVRRTLHESVFSTPVKGSAEGGLQQAPSREPTPEFSAEFVDVCDSLFNSLDDPELLRVATLRIEGHNDTEIAEKLNCSRRTIQRRLEVIRRHWEALGIENE